MQDTYRSMGRGGRRARFRAGSMCGGEGAAWSRGVRPEVGNMAVDPLSPFDNLFLPPSPPKAKLWELQA